MPFTYDSEPSGIDVVHVQFLTLLLFQLGSENIANFLGNMMICPLVRQCARNWSHPVRELAFPTGVAEHETADITVEATMAASLTIITEFTRYEVCWCVPGS
jgi:hypothetical protein